MAGSMRIQSGRLPMSMKTGTPSSGGVTRRRKAAAPGGSPISVRRLAFCGRSRRSVNARFTGRALAFGLRPELPRMALTVNPVPPATAARAPGGAASGVVLQPGTVVNAQVLKVAENLVQIAIAGLAIDVISAVPLTVGQNLQLAVSQADGGTVRLALVWQGTAAAAAADAPNVALEAPAPVAPSSVAPPPNDPLTPLERIAVSAASESAATQQASLAPLFADLNAVAASSGLPPALREAVVGVLTQQTSLGPNLTGGDIQAAFQKSGLLLEASLAAETVPPDAGIPDLKAALIVLRQTPRALSRHPPI